jgi:hypothetical protein
MEGGERHARIDERGLETEVRPDEATLIQKVKFLPRQGPASQRESSLCAVRGNDCGEA